MRFGRLQPHIDAVVVVLVCLAFATAEVIAIMKDAPLGYDEAVYSVHAREIANGEQRASWLGAHRAPGLPWILAQLPIGAGEARFRVVVLGFALGAVVLTWVLGRLLATPAVGATAAVGLAASPVFASTGGLVLPDIPATAAGLAAALLLVVGLHRPRIPWWVFGVIPLTGIATWMRFGAPIAVGAALCLIVVHKRQEVRGQLGRIAALGVGTTLAAGLVLTIPTLIGSADLSAVEAIRQRQAGRSRWTTEAWRDFWDLLPAALGPWALVLAVVAFAVLFVGAVACERRQWPAASLPLSISGLTVALLAISLPHGEGRYLVPALPWLFIAVAAVIVPTARESRKAWVWTIMVVVIALLPWAPVARLNAAHDRQITSFGVLREAAKTISAEPTLPCPVMTTYAPQVEWYSGCDTSVFVATPPSAVEGSSQFTILMGRDGRRQPQSKSFDAFLDEAAMQIVEVGHSNGSLGRVWLYGFDLEEQAE